MESKRISISSPCPQQFPSVSSCFDLICSEILIACLLASSRFQLLFCEHWLILKRGAIFVANAVLCMNWSCLHILRRLSGCLLVSFGYVMRHDSLILITCVVDTDVVFIAARKVGITARAAKYPLRTRWLPICIRWTSLTRGTLFIFNPRLSWSDICLFLSHRWIRVGLVYWSSLA